MNLSYLSETGRLQNFTEELNCTVNEILGQGVHCKKSHRTERVFVNWKNHRLNLEQAFALVTFPNGRVKFSTEVNIGRLDLIFVS